MSVKIKKFDFSEQKLFKLAREIRTIVFVEEQNVEHNLELDGFDKDSVHYLLYAEEKPVATARWRKTKKGIKLERFAVLKSQRHTGLGQLILHEILADVKPFDTTIYLSAQKEATTFYEKYGFSVVGEKFFEAEIEHFEMVYNM
jgi:predicted GNAT family N-acyltransferase